MPPKRNGMSAAAIEQLIEQQVTEALAAQGNNKNSGNPHNSDSNNTVGGEQVFPIVFQGSVMAFKPKILQEAIELARSLMDQKVRAYAVRQADNIRRMDNNPRDDHVQQPPYKRLDKARAYTARSGERKEEQGHYRSECPELKNQNREKQDRSSEAQKRVYALGGGKTNQDPSNITDDIGA
nr:hypothetical protein [Tanacetum cinerariifolium]